MSLLRRFGFFGFGFTIGILILLFVLNGKKAACSYLPNDRMLANMHYKAHFYSAEVLKILHQENLDTTELNKIFEIGDINFSKSKVHIKPCRFYWIDGTIKNKKLSVIIKNCVNNATFQKIEIYAK